MDLSNDNVTINIEEQNNDMCIKVKKIDNLFTTEDNTPLNILKENITNFTKKIIQQIDKNELINDIYIGYIQNSNIKGEGILIKKNNVCIKGTFNSVYNIIDSKVSLKNITLEGMIKNGDFYSGILTDNNENIKMVGSFKDGLAENSIKYYENDIIYEGECKNGKFNGIGCYTNGILSYEGEWLNNKFNGNGLIITNSYNYNGAFNDGKKHGTGKLEIENREYFVTYDNDIEINRLDFSEKKIQDLEIKISDLENNDKNNTLIIKQQEKQILEYNNKIKSVENQKKQLEEQFNCKVCFRNISNLVLQPCNHVVICETCEANMRTTQNGRRCPVCRKPYTKCIKIFV
jgi:hypothetical protein